MSAVTRKRHYQPKAADIFAVIIDGYACALSRNGEIPASDGVLCVPFSDLKPETNYARQITQTEYLDTRILGINESAKLHFCADSPEAKMIAEYESRGRAFIGSVAGEKPGDDRGTDLLASLSRPVHKRGGMLMEVYAYGRRWAFAQRLRFTPEDYEKPAPDVSKLAFGHLPQEAL